jgi:hypothetical protein
MFVEELAVLGMMYGKYILSPCYLALIKSVIEQDSSGGNASGSWGDVWSIIYWDTDYPD